MGNTTHYSIDAATLAKLNRLIAKTSVSVAPTFEVAVSGTGADTTSVPTIAPTNV